MHVYCSEAAHDSFPRDRTTDSLAIHARANASCIEVYISVYRRCSRRLRTVNSRAGRPYRYNRWPINTHAPVHLLPRWAKLGEYGNDEIGASERPKLHRLLRVWPFLYHDTDACQLGKYLRSIPKKRIVVVLLRLHAGVPGNKTEIPLSTADRYVPTAEGLLSRRQQSRLISYFELPKLTQGQHNKSFTSQFTPDRLTWTNTQPNSTYASLHTPVIFTPPAPSAHPLHFIHSPC